MPAPFNRIWGNEKDKQVFILAFLGGIVCIFLIRYLGESPDNQGISLFD